MEETHILTVVIPPAEDLPVENETQAIEERSRVCPLCGCKVKFFFINFQEQILICENVECQFPFGYEDLEFKRIDEVDVSDEASIRTRCSRFSVMSPTGTMISAHAWSEIDKMNQVYDEDSQTEEPKTDTAKKEVTKLDNASMNEINKNVDSIKGLHEELKELCEPSAIIKNEKWIKKLLNLQSKTKESLLKPQEMEQIKEDKILQPEIKIDIQKGDDQTISAIQINLA